MRISSYHRLRRAKTMLSGAVFIDNEDESDIASTKSSEAASNDHGSNLSDAAEDALMEQVVIASHMKTELMATVKKLHDDSECTFDDDEGSDEFGGNDTLEENNIKPSDLRRLSCDSQLLHFKNIANMKKRKSLTEEEMARESSLAEITEHVPMECEPVVEKKKVAELSEVFTQRSKKHMSDSTTRRRTVGDEYWMDEDDAEGSGIMTSETISGKPVTFEFDSSKGVSKNAGERYPRHSGNLNRSATWSSVNWDSFNKEKYMRAKTSIDTDFKSISPLNLEFQEQTASRTTTTAVDKEETLDEFRVANLVNLHDKMIREKSTPSYEDNVEVSHLVSALDQDLKGDLSINLKRVQSFPKRKIKLPLKSDTKDELRSEDATRSLPSSPSISKRLGDNDKSNDQNNASAVDGNNTGESILPDVKRIVNKYEIRQRSIDIEEEDDRKRSHSLGAKADTNTVSNDAVRRRSSSAAVDLRSFDEKSKSALKKT